MNIHDLSALINVRNHAIQIRENKKLFNGQSYRQVNTVIREIDEFVSQFILAKDLIELTKNEPVKKASAKKSSKKTAVKVDSSDDSSQQAVSKVEQQAVSKVDDIKQAVSKKTSKKTAKKTSLEDDDDAALISKAVSAQKAKLKKKTA